MSVVGVAPANPVVPGNWYYGVNCSSCHKDVMVFDDVTKGKRAKPFGGGGTFQLQCPHCQAGKHYRPEEFLSFQAVSLQ